MAATERHVLMPARARLGAVAAMAPWLARGNRLADAAPGFIPALTSYFRSEGELPVAALIRQLVAGDAKGHQWLCADPAWVQPEVNGARLLACGDELRLSAGEADALRADLVEAFAAHGFAFEMADASHWQLRLPAFAELPRFAGPDEARGADLFDHLPPGTDGRRWRAVLGEVQIVLHNHPVNQMRRERGAVPVNSVFSSPDTRPDRMIPTTSTGLLGIAITTSSTAKPSTDTVVACRSPRRAASLGANTTLEIATHSPQPQKTRPTATALQPSTNGDHASTVKNAAV